MNWLFLIPFPKLFELLSHYQVVRVFSDWEKNADRIQQQIKTAGLQVAAGGASPAPPCSLLPIFCMCFTADTFFKLTGLGVLLIQPYLMYSTILVISFTDESSKYQEIAWLLAFPRSSPGTGSTSLYFCSCPLIRLMRVFQAGNSSWNSTGKIFWGYNVL